MASRNLEYSRDNIDFGTAVDIVRHEIEENSSFKTEVTGQDSNMSRTIKSSMNVANVIRLDGIIKVELKGQEFIMDIVQKALDSQANEKGQKVPPGGRPDPNLGGTHPDDQGFTPSEPTTAPSVGEDIEESEDWYGIVREDWTLDVTTGDGGQEPVTDRTDVVLGPFDSNRAAWDELERVNDAYMDGRAEDIEQVLIDRFWAYDQDDWWLVDAMTTDGRRGKMRMPAELAQEAEDMGYVKVVEEYVPRVDDDPTIEGPDYLREEGAEGWEGILGTLQKHPGTEPEVPSPMDQERVPQSQAEKEGRLNVANYDDPQAIAHIYENGVVSVNRDGSVRTLDTLTGFFIDRDTLEPALGYVDDHSTITEDDVEQIVRAVRRSLMEQVNGSN